jgi:hypothetical protein
VLPQLTLTGHWPWTLPLGVIHRGARVDHEDEQIGPTPTMVTAGSVPNLDQAHHHKQKFDGTIKEAEGTYIGDSKTSLGACDWCVGRGSNSNCSAPGGGGSD